MGSTAGSRRTSILPSAPLSNAEWRRIVHSWLQQANRGRIANTGTVTLGTNTFSTSVSDARVGANSIIDFMPQTAEAAADKKLMYVSSLDKQRFVITHPSRLTGNRTFTFIILG